MGAAGLGACVRQPSSQAVDVVVVGAGSAGIAAAWALIGLGHSVQVIEAMGRVGGRAFTDRRTYGVPFDVGCAWLHKSDANPYTDYARRRGFTLRPHEYDLERLYLAGERQAGAARRLADQAGPLEETLSEAISALPGDGPALLAQPAPATPLQLSVGDYLGALDMAVDLDELSSADYANAADLSPNLLCAEGFGAIVARRAQGLPIRLGTPARHIRRDGRGVSVETDHGRLKGRAVVVTASTGVLNAGAIRFTPELPVALRQAVSDVPMGMLAKIPLLIPRERFGLSPFEDVLVSDLGRESVYFLAFPFATDLMIGFVGGDFGWELSAAGEAAAVDHAKQALARAFGSAAPSRVVKAGLTDWASNPYTRGAYAAARPGRFAARAQLRQPVDDQIFLAGEALGGELIQTCGGAWLSGLDTAWRVHQALAR